MILLCSLALPPKLLWLRLGDCTTQQIEQALRGNREGIVQWLADPTSASLVLQ